MTKMTVFFLFLATIYSVYGLPSIYINAQNSDNQIQAIGSQSNSDEDAAPIIQISNLSLPSSNGNVAESEEEPRALRQLISKLNESIAVSLMKITELWTQDAKTEGNITESGEEIRALQLHISQLNESMEISKRKLVELENKNSEVEESIEESQKKIVELENENTEVKGNIAESGEEIGRLDLHVSKLNESVEQNVKKVEELVSQNSELEASLESSRKKVEELESQNLELQENAVNSSLKIAELERQNSKTEEKLVETRVFLQRSVGGGNIDCKDLLDEGNTTDGVHTIYVDWTPVQVACDMTNGGWTIFQHRYDGSTNFRQDFQSYQNGFGDPNGEYWLGLEQIHQMTKEGSWVLRVDLTPPDNDTGYAEYDDFKIGASPRYQLQVGSYNGTAGDAMAYSNGRAFSTYDRDRDDSSYHCASDGSHNGAWWWGGCGHSNINSYTYNDNRYRKGMYWHHWKGFSTPMKITVMRIRRM